MSGMSWLFKWPYTEFDFGILALFLGVVYTYLEKTWGGRDGWVYRAKEPRRYWLQVATYYFVGAASIGYFWYLVNRH